MMINPKLRRGCREKQTVPQYIFLNDVSPGSAHKVTRP